MYHEPMGFWPLVPKPLICESLDILGCKTVKRATRFIYEATTRRRIPYSAVSRYKPMIRTSTQDTVDFPTQRVLSTNIGNTYPSHKGSYYYRNHTLYHQVLWTLWVRNLGSLVEVVVQAHMANDFAVTSLSNLAKTCTDTCQKP